MPMGFCRAKGDHKAYDLNKKKLLLIEVAFEQMLQFGLEYHRYGTYNSWIIADKLLVPQL